MSPFSVRSAPGKAPPLSWSGLIKALSALLRGMHSLVAVVLFVALTYLLGHKILDGPMQGNDSALHVAYAQWLNQYFPTIPHWYPLQGGGISLLHGYPILSHLIVVSVHRLTGLSILEAFRLITFLAFPLTAFGIYLFSWSSLRNQTIGLIAGVLYLLAPITWTWMYDWGFFSQHVAIAFLPFALIAFDRSFDCQLDHRRSGRGRLWFVALALLLSLSFLCHMMVGSAIAGGMTLYVLLATLVAQRDRKRATLHGGIKVVALTGFTLGLLLAFYIVPFYAYGQVANREGLNTPPPQDLHRLPILEFFGLRPVDLGNLLTRFQFPLFVTIFAAVGLVLGWVYARKGRDESRKTLSLALVCAAATVYALSPGLVAVVLRVSSILFMFVNFRSALLLVMVLLPLIAGYGIWALAHAVLCPEELLGFGRARIQTRGRSRPPLRAMLVSIGTLLMAAGGILPIGGIVQADSSARDYGPLAGNFRLDDVWGRGGGNPGESLFAQFAPNNWPAFAIADTDASIDQSRALGSLLPQERPLRIDISPYLGRVAMDLVTYADASQINSYTFQASLIHAMWGYQQNVFFGRTPGVDEYGNPTSLKNVAQWFGTSYVFLNPTFDALETYQGAGWEMVHEAGSPQLWRNPDAPVLATATTRPVILIIGTPSSGAYMTIFRLANDGMLPYDEAILVEGQPRVDRYTPEELEPFDAVVLHGYDYRNSRRAWDTLAEYVRQGGNLFVDTGWEFWIPEWEFERAPDVLPVNRLTWTDYGMTSDYSLGFPEASGDVDVSLFRPLEWEGQAWTLSGAQPEDLRDWGRVVLSAAGRPLVVAGEFGQGRVVWSGMNLIGHARYLGRNEEEIRLIRNLIMWLTERAPGMELPDPLLSRTDPDRVELRTTVVPGDVTWLYWREAYYPDWHAYLSDNSGTREIPVYRAGPGFMLMPVQSASDVAATTLVWEPSLVEKGGFVASALGLLLLAAIALDGLMLDGNGFTWLKIVLTIGLPKPILGDGASLEWAEKKMAETVAARKKIRREHGGQELPLDTQLSDEQAALLRSWLEDAGNGDDTWAARVIKGKRE